MLGYIRRFSNNRKGMAILLSNRGISRGNDVGLPALQRSWLQRLQRRHVAGSVDLGDNPGMAKGSKAEGKGVAPPVVSTLPPPEPVKPRRKRSLPDDIPRGELPARKRKPAPSAVGAVAKPARKTRAKSAASDTWDAGREAMLAKQAVLERQKADGFAKEFAAPAKRARKAKAAEPVVERRLEPMPHGGALKRSTADKPDPREKAPTKTGAPVEPVKRVRVGMTDDIFSVIIGEIAEGVTLRQICRRETMPSKSAFYLYLEGDDLDGEEPSSPDIRGGRFARYARARKLGYDALAEESMEIADDGTNDWVEREKEDGRLDVEVDRDHIQRSKLRIETRLKLLAVWDPKRYGQMIKVGDPDAKPIDNGGKSASDIAIGMAKLIAAAQREQGAEA